MVVRRTTTTVFWLSGDFFGCLGRTDNQNLERWYTVSCAFGSTLVLILTATHSDQFDCLSEHNDTIDLQ